MRIAFSPPDITEEEIEEVSQALRSGWITTGPRTKAFEQALAQAVGTAKVACLFSATAALECALRALDIGPGDEVITSPYTYSASASVIYHVGAQPVMVDTAPDSYEMDYSQLSQAITPRTKAIIPIDIAGKMCDYQRLFAAIDAAVPCYSPKVGSLQECFDRPIVLSDAAHSFGAAYQGQPSGLVADLTAFSFHAVKNLTTAEGGALTWRSRDGLNDEALYERIMLLSLHGQTKDALAKLIPGSWEYDIVEPAWKCNMTDLTAALGLVQLKRYPELLERRRQLVRCYMENLAAVGMLGEGSEGKLDLLEHLDPSKTSSCHLLLTRLIGKDQGFRNALIRAMAERGIACNVHYKPLPLLTAYRERGFDISDYPNAFAQFANELTLPLHTLLSDDDVRFIAESMAEAYSECERADA